MIGINGAAAKLVNQGDKVIIVNYAFYTVNAACSVASNS